MKVAFVYDYMGRRVEKKVWTWDPQAGQGGDWVLTWHRKFVWNGWLLLMELDGLNDDAVLRKRTWGLDLSGLTGGGSSTGLASSRSVLEGAGGIGGLLAVYDTNGTTTAESPEADGMAYVYFYDANGNVGQVCDLSHTPSDPAGAIVARYEYDPYGNVTSQSGTYAATNPFRFSTKYFDDETGLGYWGYRYYDPKLGRWASASPPAVHDGAHYQFFANSPASRASATVTGDFSAEDARAHCAQAIDRRRKAEAEMAKNPPPPLSKDETSRCQSKVKSLIDNARQASPPIVDGASGRPGSPLGGIHWDLLRWCRRGVPSIICRCCRKGQLGGYRRDKHVVTICWNNLKDSSDDEIARTLTHELVHAMQNCLAPDRLTGCKGALKDELGAYYCAGECTDFDSCMKRALNSACGAHCKSPGEITDGLYDELRGWFTNNQVFRCTFPRDPEYPKPKLPGTPDPDTWLPF